MTTQPLPPELISLVHHVELNKAGWWDKGVQQLLITTLWLSGRAHSVPEILSDVKKFFQIDLDSGKARSHLTRLSSAGVLIQLPGGEQFKIAESFLKKYETDFTEAQETERAVEDLFTKLLNQYCPGLDTTETWRHFNKDFLAPFIKEIGATTYKLLSEGSFNLHPARFERFLKPYPPELHGPFNDAVQEFLDPKNSHVRSYILRSLNAYFFIEASSLKEDTLEALIRFTGSRPKFNIFVDTNFLFALLGLIPDGDDTGQSLMRLSGRLSTNVLVKLYALPTTIDEAKRKLIMTKQSLHGLRVAPNLADAALRMKLDGLHLKFFEESRRRGLLTAEAYFDPYINDLTAIMRTRGVELFNEEVDSYKTKQSVIDDIMTQLRLEEKRYKNRAKNYEKLEHDMILWHFVRDKRPKGIESPLEAKYWMVTIDYRMLGFDKFKKRHSKKEPSPNTIPICLYPTTLIQMLQFWVPRTPEFEEAMLSSMRAPFFYRGFDPAAERVTLDILQALSRFQNIGDLPTETVSSILVNTALRQKMSLSHEIEKKVDLVREALIEQDRQTKKKLAEMSEKLLARERELQSESAERLTKEHELAERNKDLRDLQEKIRELEATSLAEKNLFSQRVSDLEEAAREKESNQQARKARLSFVARWVLGPVIPICLVAAALAILISRTVGWNVWILSSGILSLALILQAAVIDRSGSRIPDVNNSALFARFKKSRNWLIGFFAAVLASVVASFIYAAIKAE